MSRRSEAIPISSKREVPPLYWTGCQPAGAGCRPDCAAGHTITRQPEGGQYSGKGSGATPAIFSRPPPSPSPSSSPKRKKNVVWPARSLCVLPGYPSELQAVLGRGHSANLAASTGSWDVHPQNEVVWNDRMLAPSPLPRKDLSRPCSLWFGVLGPCLQRVPRSRWLGPV